MKIIISLLLLILTFYSLKGQNCYEVKSDMSGIDISPYQSELMNFACSLRDSFPEEFQNDFTVFDLGFYSISEYMEGGFESFWEKLKIDAASQSMYYLIFAKVNNSNGLNTEFWVDLKLPSSNVFSCLDQMSPNLRGNLSSKYESIANEIHEENEKMSYLYHEAEIEVMVELGKYISELKNCCDYQTRSLTSCSSCVLNASQYERKLLKSGMMAFDVESVIDETTINMGNEEVGYKIVSNGITIDLDDAMTSLKESIITVFPNVTVQVYPCNYLQGCSDYETIQHNWLNSSADIGIIIGVIGEDGESGTVSWRMISNDDLEINPTTFDSDTCYYFSNDNFFSDRGLCETGIRPRGVLDLIGINYEFRFADPILTPRTLTSEDAVDSFYLETNEPMINRLYEMRKPKIFAQLAEAIPDQDNDGKFKSGAFDVHLFSPWSLYQGSSGWNGPFDYSTKVFFAERNNYIFITDDGDNIVGHNFRNMGNFLWGAATYIMGIPQWFALSAAHINNLTTEEGLTLDAPDDQYSIRLGRYYARKMNWKTIYGGKNNIFR